MMHSQQAATPRPILEAMGAHDLEVGDRRRLRLVDLRARGDQIRRIAASHGASNVRVFGSVARGTEGPDSDVDLLVDFEPGRTLLDQVGLWQDLEAVLGRSVDVVSAGGLTDRDDDIRREAVLL